ncbi:gp115 (endogenous virus) [Lactococcus phage KSY1]|uniref:Gp115 n=1 Tax=Lactococcus phage KSY1 TaxID=2913972 RepID=A6MAI0_9CAUD|nr:gp115 [Lactococcus phage KSY1]ABG21658.1 gp115 [Lactococcus phage KSY1]
MKLKEAVIFTLNLFVVFGIAISVIAFISWIGTFSPIAAVALAIIALFVLVTSLIYALSSWWEN